MSAPLNSNECQKPLTGQSIANNIEQIGGAMGLSQECVKEAQNQFSAGQMSGSVNIPFADMKASASFTQADNKMRQAGCGQFFVNSSDQLTSTHNMVCTLEKNSNQTVMNINAGSIIRIDNEWSTDFAKIMSRNFKQASKEAAELRLAIIKNPPKTQAQADLFNSLVESAEATAKSFKPPSINVKDSVIEEVSASLNLINKLVIHTSGAIDQDVIKYDRRGVLYPLQTFSKKKKLNFKNIPFCIEASKSQDYKTLIRLANLLSPMVYNIDSHQRKVLHVAAVFACNFSNYMYMISDEILSKESIPLDILYPLIKETASKITKHKPKDVQTGPAARKDKSTIDTHLKYLNQGKNYDIYKILTKNIIANNEL